MKPTNDQIAAPRFVTRNRRRRTRLVSGPWRGSASATRMPRKGDDLLLTPDVHARRKYAVAKFSARGGDLEPLRIILVNIMRDPEIAEFIAEPRRPRGRQRRPQLILKQSIARCSKELGLAHMIGSDVEKAYRSSDMFDKRRRLLEDWAKFCTSPQEAGVVTPTRARV
jgi:hypothetical protein